MILVRNFLSTQSFDFETEAQKSIFACVDLPFGRNLPAVTEVQKCRNTQSKTSKHHKFSLMTGTLLTDLVFSLSFPANSDRQRWRDPFSSFYSTTPAGQR